MTRMADLQARRRVLLARCAQQRVELAQRLAVLRPHHTRAAGAVAQYGARHPLAWMAVLAGEMAGINSGLGYLIIMGQQMYNMKLVMIGIIAIGMIGFFMDRLLLLIQRRILWWERS